MRLYGRRDSSASMMKSLRVALKDHAAKTKIVSWLMKMNVTASPSVHTMKIAMNVSENAHSTLMSSDSCVRTGPRDVWM